MKNENTKRIVLIILITLVAVAFIAVAYALISENYKVEHKITTGTLTIEDINLQIEDRLTETMQDKITKWSPGDASLLTWDTVNTGTSAAKTRHTITVYWDNAEIGDIAKDLLYIYPANMTNQQVIEDFNNGKQSDLGINENATIQIDGENKLGITYTVYGDTLDGTDITGVATQVDYDSKESNINDYTTQENDATSDKLAFRILLSPTTSYLLQEETLSVRVVTEAMQYTEDGTGNWEIQSVQDL